MATLYLPQITNADIIKDGKQRWRVVCLDYSVWEKQPRILGKIFSPVWNEIKFLKSNKRLIPSGPGIYMFVVKSSPDLHTNAQQRYILYVGQATNLRDRYSQYFGYANTAEPSDQLKRIMTLVWENRLYYNYFETPATFTDKQLTAIEFDLIDKIVPPMNLRFRAHEIKQYVKFYAPR